MIPELAWEYGKSLRTAEYITVRYMMTVQDPALARGFNIAPVRKW